MIKKNSTKSKSEIVDLISYLKTNPNSPIYEIINSRKTGFNERILFHIINYNLSKNFIINFEFYFRIKKEIESCVRQQFHVSFLGQTQH